MRTADDSELEQGQKWALRLLSVPPQGLLTLEQRDAALAQSRRHLQLAERVIESSLEGIIITDPQLTIQFVNPAFTQLTGYQPEEVIGRTPAILSSGRHDSEFYREMWETLSSTGRWRGRELAAATDVAAARPHFEISHKIMRFGMIGNR